MARTIEAVYQKGVFVPLRPVRLEEGEAVHVYLPYECDSLTPEQVHDLVRESQEALEQLTQDEWAKIAHSWQRDKQCAGPGTPT